MKYVFCANCGTRLNIKRKALPKLGRIVDIVEYHKCPDEPVEFDLTPIDIPKFNEVEYKNKFVQNLNELQPQTIFKSESIKFGDRRKPEDVKSTVTSSAPASLNNLIETLSPSNLTNDVRKEPKSE